MSVEEIQRETERRNIRHVNDTRHPGHGDITEAYSKGVEALIAENDSIRAELALARERLGPAGWRMIKRLKKMEAENDRLQRERDAFQRVGWESTKRLCKKIGLTEIERDSLAEWEKRK